MRCTQYVRPSDKMAEASRCVRLQWATANSAEKDHGVEEKEEDRASVAAGERKRAIFFLAWSVRCMLFWAILWHNGGQESYRRVVTGFTLAVFSGIRG